MQTTELSETKQNMFTSTNDERVMMAIAATKTVQNPVDYWATTCAQRAGANPNAAGSVYERLSADEVEWLVKGAKGWELYEHPALMHGCVAFKVHGLVGRVGVVDLAKLAGDATVVLDDRKNTGAVSATVRGVLGDTVDFTVIILGLHEGKEVVYTFHPGEPVPASEVKVESGLHGKEITAAQALDMGLTTAKIIA